MADLIVYGFPRSTFVRAEEEAAALLEEA